VRPLVIVGGGPAGIAAAIEAARAGLRPTLVDEGGGLGGQIYRPLPEGFLASDAAALGKDFRRGEELRGRFAEVAGSVDLILGVCVLGIWEGRRLLTDAGEIVAERIVLATGACDRPVPFPGWTLPGVLTAGGAQVLVKTMRVSPGRRALVAGTGPLLPVVANQLHGAGVEVVAVLEAGRPPPLLRSLPRIWGEWGLIRDAWDLWRGLRRARIPLLFGHTIFEAAGEGGVERATYGRVDASDWRPLRESAKTVDVDLVVTGFGFVPNTELSVLAGCDHEYAHGLGGFVPVRDPCMRTSVRHVLAAGDGAGVAGALVAAEEGRIAGITAAEDGGVLAADEARRRRTQPLRRLASLARVRGLLDEMSRVRPGLVDLATPATVVCRCEEVLLSEVRAAFGRGARDLQALKLMTRLGMGPCQGRNCGPSASAICCKELGVTPEDAGRIEPRPPVKPVTFGALAGGAK